MKEKTKQKLSRIAVGVITVLFAIAVLLSPLVLAYFVEPIGGGAKAESAEPEETDSPIVAETVEVEKEPVITEQMTLDGFFNRYIVPIVGGTVGTVLIGLLAILRPYIKRVGENKTLKVAYSATKDKLDLAEKTVKELKDKLEGMDINDLLEKLTMQAVSIAQEKAQNIIKLELDKRSDLTGQILADVELVSAQLQSLISAAAVTWQSVDGVPKLLATSPTATALEKQAKSVQFLKTLIADRLGMETAEIQAMLDGAIDSSSTATANEKGVQENVKHLEV